MSLNIKFILIILCLFYYFSDIIFRGIVVYAVGTKLWIIKTKLIEHFNYNSNLEKVKSQISNFYFLRFLQEHPSHWDMWNLN